MTLPIALLTRSPQPSAWEHAVRAALTAADRQVLQLPAEPGGKMAAGFGLLIDLTESGAGIDIARRMGVPVWLLCHGPGIRFDLGDSIKSGFVAGDPFIEVRLVEWRPGTGTAGTVSLFRLRRRKTPGRAIDSVRMAAVNWFADALRGPRVRQDGAEQDLQVTRGDTPAPWRLKAATLRSLSAMAADLFTVEEWNVGVAPGGPAEVFDSGLMARVAWLPPMGRFRFRADPFGWRDAEGRTVLLYETFDYREGKGRIVRNLAGAEDIIGDFPYHASYPFLIDHDGRRHALPELSEMACPALFPVDGQSPPWSGAGVPLDGLQGVPLSDGTIFTHGGRYWLFGMRADQESGAALHAWHADALPGPWTPHKRNPIKIDVTSSRPGGTPFLWQGDLIRPAQDCSTSYGAAVVLNRIDTLTPYAFEETPVARIAPDPRSNYRDGVHTLNVADGLIILDAKRHARRLLAPFHRWRRVQRSKRRAVVPS